MAAHIEGGDARSSSVLIGVATITVSGRLAQFGGRLLVPVADAMLAQFADNFRLAAEAVPPPAGLATGATGTVAHLPAPRSTPRELNALALMWMVIKSWFAGLFGKKAA